MAAEHLELAMSGARKCPDHHSCTAGNRADPIAHQVTQTSLDPIAVVGRTDLLGHDETDGRDVRRFDRSTHVDDEVRLNTLATTTDRLAEHLTVAHAVHARQHAESGRQLVATLATTRRQDRATRTRTHAETEAVLLGAAAVVRLVGALAHWKSFGTDRGHWEWPPLAHDRMCSWARGGRRARRPHHGTGTGMTWSNRPKEPTFIVPAYSRSRRHAEGLAQIAIQCCERP